MPKVDFNSLPGQNLPQKYEETEYGKVDYEAERAFRRLKYEIGNKWVALRKFKRLYPGYTPERFRSTGNMKMRKGYESLRGRASESRDDNCGDMGRLRVIAGEPLWWSRLFFSELPNPKLHGIEKDPIAQFQQQTKEWVKADLEKIIKGPFIAVIEMGRHGRNHVHVFHLKGACRFGTARLIPDNKLPEKAGYIKKNPYWNDRNALAYLTSHEFDGQARNRIIKKGLGNARSRTITVRDVENATGLDLFGTKKFRDESN